MEAGVWVVWSYADYGVNVHSIYEEEIQALRVVNNGDHYGAQAKFVPFGTDITYDSISEKEPKE